MFCEVIKKSCFISLILYIAGAVAGNVSPARADENMVTVESLQYEWEALKAATKNFSIDHKIGQGGFGAVYKVLPLLFNTLFLRAVFKACIWPLIS